MEDKKQEEEPEKACLAAQKAIQCHWIASNTMSVAERTAGMAERKTSRRAVLRVILLSVCAMALATGCIRSMVRVTSQPSDARVFINDVERGRTPVEAPIIWYWWYKIRVEKEGYEVVEASERFKAPPWAWMPLDLFAEALPIPIKNTYHRHYSLKPKETE